MDQQGALADAMSHGAEQDVTGRGTDTRDAADLRKVWWLVALVGVAGVAAGIILLVEPAGSLSTLTVVVGILLLLEGVVALFTSLLGDARNTALAAVGGVLGIILGIALIRNPFGGVNAVGIVIGLWLVLAGAIGIARSITDRRHRIIRAVVACAEIAAGVIIVSEPRIGYTALAIIAGIWLIVSGLATIAFSVSVHRADG